MGLHTRGFKFCKLRNGSFICVPPVLVQRCKSQFHSLPCGVDLVLGLNGYIWIHKKFQGLNADETDPTVQYTHVNDVSERSFFFEAMINDRYLLMFGV